MIEIYKKLKMFFEFYFNSIVEFDELEEKIIVFIEKDLGNKDLNNIIEDINNSTYKIEKKEQKYLSDYFTINKSGNEYFISPMDLIQNNIEPYLDALLNINQNSIDKNDLLAKENVDIFFKNNNKNKIDSKLDLLKKFLSSTYNYQETNKQNMVDELKNELGLKFIEFVTLENKNFYDNIKYISQEEKQIYGIENLSIDDIKTNERLNNLFSYSFIEIDKLDDGNYQIQCRGFVCKKIFNELKNLI